MATSRHVMLMVVATLVVLFVGSADAWGCPSGYKNCDPHKEGCKTCILNDVKNCGDCGKECKKIPYTTVKCENKQCVYKRECNADIYKDVNNCGKCGNRCKEIPDTIVKCENKQCVYKKKCNADTKNDVNNCGKCGNKCKVEWKDGEVTCKDGQCKQQCKHGYEYDWTKKCCVPKCKADTMNDVNNCGKCGNKCKVEWKDGEVTCKYGQCKQQCKHGYEYDWTKKCCIPKCKADTMNDVNNCGKCGNKCKVEWKDGEVTCKYGQCKQQCKHGYEYDWTKKCCVPKCKADTMNDVDNCGKCGNKCKVEWKDGEVTCKYGQCKQQCKHGYEYDWTKKCCVPKCKADTMNDVNNCGKCGNKCKVEWKDGEVTCKYGQCKQQCKHGYEYDWTKKCCIPKCKADTMNDVNNCGKCGNKCKVEWKDGEVTCKYGQCKQQCKHGYEYDWTKKCCVPKCKADTMNDVDNCGKCGNKCKVEWKDGEVTCKYGQCKQQCKHGYEYDWKKKCCVPKKY